MTDKRVYIYSCEYDSILLLTLGLSPVCSIAFVLWVIILR
jgi:nitrate reductase NapE component